MQFEILGCSPRPGKQWQIGEETARELESAGKLEMVDGIVKRAVYPEDEDEADVGFIPFWAHLKDVGTSQAGKSELTAIVGRGHGIDTVKPVSLITAIARHIPNAAGLFVDFFAGSGTTGHAVINLNREDGGRRKFILVEMGDYFDTVLLPRIQKVIYCPDWKEGKPVGYPEPSLAGMWPDWVARTARLVKVIRLEGYEDALHNLATEETLTRERERSAAYKEAMGGDAYRLRYLARLPLEASSTMLATDKLEHPFDYTLEVLTDEGPAIRSVDLVETFNYLYGLRVQRVETWRNEADGREYRAVSGHRADGQWVLVLWRDTGGLNPETERAFLGGRLGGYDEVLINGDCAVPGVASLDPLFKRLMEARQG